MLNTELLNTTNNMKYYNIIFYLYNIYMILFDIGFVPFSR